MPCRSGGLVGRRAVVAARCCAGNRAANPPALPGARIAMRRERRRARWGTTLRPSIGGKAWPLHLRRPRSASPTTCRPAPGIRGGRTPSSPPRDESRRDAECPLLQRLEVVGVTDRVVGPVEHAARVADVPEEGFETCLLYTSPSPRDS